MTASNPPIYNGRYELQRQIARGGTAQVYLARDIILDRPVALKVLFPELSTDPTFVERFRREAQAAANLSHPNIVPVFDWGESEKTYFIVMEYVDGEPLSSIIHSSAPLTPGNAAQIAADIAKALSYAHRHGVVHRDVKPGNVLITSDGQVKVTDFGIARAIGGGEEQVTQTGLVMGTATYFSPEQAQGLGVDGRSDIYSLGVVLYEMLAGKPPFAGETPVSIAYKHVQETPARPRSVNPAIPAALEAVVMQAMAKLPAERYQNADDFRADLERFLHRQTVLASPPSEFAGAQQTELLQRATAAYGAVPPPSTTAVAATDYREPRARTTTPYWATAAVILLLGIAAAVVIGGRSLGYFGGVTYVRVPDVRAMTLSAAESTLRQKGFDPVVTRHVTGTTSTENTVTAQSPEAPDTARKGSVIDLTVATSVPRATVPSVTGESRSKATSALEKAGFKVATKNVPATSATQTKNEVVAQSPAANSSRLKGTTVTISVVQTQATPVPSVAGDNQAQAGVAISKAGFNVGTINQAFSSTVPQGQVISTNPAAGTLLKPGSSVSLNVSEGAGVTIPNLLGMTAAQASSTLQALNLVPVQGAPIGTQIPGYVGFVAEQSTEGYPTAGPNDTVPPGTKIKFRIGVATGAAVTTTTLPSNTGVGNTGAGTSGAGTTTIP